MTKFNYETEGSQRKLDRILSLVDDYYTLGSNSLSEICNLLVKNHGVSKEDAMDACHRKLVNVNSFESQESKTVEDKIIAILTNSDIVWTKYGGDTIEELAKRIVNKLRLEN